MSECRNTLETNKLRAPVYHRQRLLLFLLEQAGGHLDKLDLQKLLFLYVQESRTKHFAFLPFKYGCYSFLAASDLALLCKRGWVKEDNHAIKLQSNLAFHPWALKSEERRQMRQWMAKTPLRGDSLIREVYQRYPYYAIHSEIKERLVDKADLKRIRDAARPKGMAGKALYTLGYEGVHFEHYVNTLLKNGVRVLCDVRQNPLSRKFGFSKKTLSSLLPRLNIRYEHVPDLGIASESRQKLENEQDRKVLLDAYEKTLANRKEALDQVLALVNEHDRIALTCFEKEAHRCHRQRVAACLARRHGLRVLHL